VVLDSRFAGSNTAEDNAIVTVDKNPQHEFLRREVKPSPHVVIYFMLKNPTTERDSSFAKFISSFVMFHVPLSDDCW
jgi:hypothetical protein